MEGVERQCWHSISWPNHDQCFQKAAAGNKALRTLKVRSFCRQKVSQLRHGVPGKARQARQAEIRMHVWSLRCCCPGQAMALCLHAQHATCDIQLLLWDQGQLACQTVTGGQPPGLQPPAAATAGERSGGLPPLPFQRQLQPLLARSAQCCP